MSTMKKLINFPNRRTRPEITLARSDNGMLIYFVLPSNDYYYLRERNKCSSDNCLSFIQPNCQLSHQHYEGWMIPSREDRRENDFLSHQLPMIYIDVGLLVGSTKRVFQNELTGNYWLAEYKDLTKEGKNLFKTLTKIYGMEPDIVTLLDT